MVHNELLDTSHVSFHHNCLNKPFQNICFKSLIYKNTGNGKKQGPSTTLKANVLQNFFCCLSCVSNNIIIIIAISVASSSLNNPVHKLVQEDGHGKLPVLEIFRFLILFYLKRGRNMCFVFSDSIW
mgnify:CR=1 FL=1